ncbi:hypothetical protein EYZ11_005999 [Aspergillus tanneri]|uniref:Uncharacterized protein n=1 Tax=Aspergillus tanneri TaxID=1220188 RepID=A0A4S3JIV5_9EURO|nr:hypothetical protein EYZ11_005999 [Aspergillus tanneri]
MCYDKLANPTIVNQRWYSTGAYLEEFLDGPFSCVLYKITGG